MEPRVGFEPTVSSLLVRCFTIKLSGHLELCCLSKLSSVYPLCILVFQKAFKAWRRRQDSNLHAVADERFSRPWQYQLCLLLHRRVLFFMRIPAHWVTRFLPRAGLDLLFINRLKMLSSALGGATGTRTQTTLVGWRA